MSGAVPELRFPGFEGEWEQRRAGDAFSKGKAKGTAGLPIYSVTLDRGLVPRNSLDRHMAEDAADGANLRAEPGDIVYNTMRMWQGAAGVADTTCMVSSAYIVLKPKKGTNSAFFNHRFGNGRMLHLLWAYSHGLTSDRLRLYFDDFAQIPIRTPSLAEQTKIAEFLGVVDAKLAALRRKKGGLETFKSGLMQQLFAQTLRFTRDDGTDFPDWEEKTLGELTVWRSGGTPSKDDPTFWDGDIPWISASSMHDTKVYDSELRVTSSAIGKGTRIAKKGTILLLVRGSMLYKRIPVCVAMRDVAFNQDVKALVAQGGISSDFLLHWLIAQEAVLLAMVTGTGIGAGKLETGEVQGISVSLPHPDEQRKIADALSALDAKINAVGEQIAHMQTFKQGLLQQMFV